MWSLEKEVLLNLNCRSVGRNFTLKEWQRYFSDEPYSKTCRNRPLDLEFLKVIENKLIDEGDIENALANLKTALKVDGVSEATLQSEALRLAALILVEPGKQLARKGEINAAVAEFKKALTVDPSLDLEPEKEAKRLAAPSLFEEGERLAKNGKIDTAIDKFKEALTFDPALDLNPEKEAKRLVVPNLVKEGERLAEKGEINAALKAFAEAQANDPSFKISSYTWNNLCWEASVRGFVADVMFACEKAVELEPDNGGNRDSRGVARALTGDFPGAIEDFQHYIQWAQKQNRWKKRILQRQDWIKKLQAKQNPFNEEVLKQIRDQ